MKKIILVLLSAVMLVSFTACGNEKKEDQTGTSVPSASEDKTTPTESKSPDDIGSIGILDSFVKEDEVYFDIHVSDDAIKNFSITVGNETFSESKSVTFNANDTIKVNGEPNEDADLYVYRVYRKTEDGNIKISNLIGKGVHPERLEKMLQSSYSAVKEGERTYFAILDTPTGWNRNLSSELNDYLDSLTK